jgi:hypothetical protein
MCVRDIVFVCFYNFFLFDLILELLRQCSIVCFRFYQRFLLLIIEMWSRRDRRLAKFLIPVVTVIVIINIAAIMR